MRTTFCSWVPRSTRWKGDKNKIQNFGGGNATVTGRVHGDTLEVTTIGHEVRDVAAKKDRSVASAGNCRHIPS
jgi:hypothetical protein